MNDKKELGPVDKSVEKVQGVVGRPFKSGDEWNGNAKGRPKGSISITTKIKQYFEKNPEEFEQLCKEYRNNKDYRKLLWAYLDGQPKASLDLGIDDDLKEAISKINSVLP